MSPLEPFAQDLLVVDAEPSVFDGRGNTALHYLAGHGLATEWDSKAARALCRYFCDHGVDVNARNQRDRTALEILMDDDGRIEEERSAGHLHGWNPQAFEEDPDGDVFGMLDTAGARWTEQDRQGQTLLHIVARRPTERAGFRARYLLRKGVDPNLKDSKGRTAADVATQHDNGVVSAILRGITR